MPSGGAVAAGRRLRRKRLNETVERRCAEELVPAAELLGSDTAATRIGGLCLLERIALRYPPFRQTVVDVICGYLRTPIGLDDPTTAAGTYLSEPDERVVRATAQGIIASHLRDTANGGLPTRAWRGISLDLRGATLVDVDLSGCHLRRVDFTRAQFLGETRLSGACVDTEATFAAATFNGAVDGAGMSVGGKISFADAMFAAGATLQRATFGGEAWLSDATFIGDADFSDAGFAGEVWFVHTSFVARADFSRTMFGASAWFTAATFGGVAGFDAAYFRANAGFGGATFMDTASFAGAAFEGAESVRDATFRADAVLDLAAGTG